MTSTYSKALVKRLQWEMRLNCLSRKPILSAIPSTKMDLRNLSKNSFGSPFIRLIIKQRSNFLNVAFYYLLIENYIKKLPPQPRSITDKQICQNTSLFFVYQILPCE